VVGDLLSVSHMPLLEDRLPLYLLSEWIETHYDHPVRLWRTPLLAKEGKHSVPTPKNGVGTHSSSSLSPFSQGGRVPIHRNAGGDVYLVEFVQQCAE
jgi:hypothetical protein